MSEQRLTISVFGGRKGSMPFGESIIIQTPGNRWGIIDSCIGEIDSPKQFLGRKNINKLDFVLLTHPHEDHYLGLADILNKGIHTNLAKYSGNSYSGRTIDPGQESFRFLTEVLGSSLSRSIPPDLKIFSNELTNLLERNDWPELRAPDELFHEEESGFQISAISPTRELCLRLDKQLQENIVKCISWSDNVENPLKIKLRQVAKRRAKIRSGINRLSVCTHLKWRDFAGLLLADAEKINLQQAYKKNRSWFYDLSFVKVAHHGGSGANPMVTKGKSLFELIAENTSKDLIAVVTHYHHQLPNSQVLDRIAHHCDEVYLISFPPDIKSGSEISKLTPDLSNLAKEASIELGAQIINIDPHEDCLTFSFDSSGKLLPESIRHDAKRWSSVRKLS